MFLTQDQFTGVVASTPLVSIDFVARNSSGQVLLGKRTNKPAKDFWFVPGGRILKSERLASAFERLSHVEFGQALPQKEGRFLGVYEHLYDDSSFDDAVSTHYVVIAYEVALEAQLTGLPAAQHAKFRWFSVEELLASDSVHENTKAYFA